MANRRSFFILFFVLSCSIFARSQDKNFVALPIVFYTPETNWGFGGGALYSFYTKGLPEKFKYRPSMVQVGGVYTLENQILSYFSFDVFKPHMKWELTGELGFYKYSYKYWGIGNTLDSDQEEIYTISFPRVRFNPRFIVSGDWRIGLNFDFNYYFDIHVQENGILDLNNTTGSNGGFANGIGGEVLFDHRDHSAFPSKGVYYNLKGLYYHKIVGSDYNFVAIDSDLRTFSTLNNQWIIASQFVMNYRIGEVPFYHLSLLGGNKIMRGFYEGRYRGNNLWAIQCELRIPIFKRFFMAPFISTGDVFSFEDYDLVLKWAGGAGIRYILNREKRVNIRFDIAHGEEFQFYLTVLEAF